MNILTLSIKQTFFDQIKAGTKKIETRDIKPTNSHKYLNYVYNGKIYKNSFDVPKELLSKVEVEIKKYDAIKFLTGAYSGTRPSMLVEVKDAEIIILVDENDQEIVYEYNGQEFISCVIEYKLGKVLE